MMSVATKTMMPRNEICRKVRSFGSTPETECWRDKIIEGIHGEILSPEK